MNRIHVLIVTFVAAFRPNLKAMQRKIFIIGAACTLWYGSLMPSFLCCGRKKNKKNSTAQQASSVDTIVTELKNYNKNSGQLINSLYLEEPWEKRTQLIEAALHKHIFALLFHKFSEYNQESIDTAKSALANLATAGVWVIPSDAYLLRIKGRTTLHYDDAQKINDEILPLLISYGMSLRIETIKDKNSWDLREFIAARNNYILAHNEALQVTGLAQVMTDLIITYITPMNDTDILAKQIVKKNTSI